VRVLLAGVLLRVLLELVRRAVVERDVAERLAEASDRARRDLAVRVVLLEQVYIVIAAPIERPSSKQTPAL
jgi:hypothetical protein